METMNETMNTTTNVTPAVKTEPAKVTEKIPNKAYDLEYGTQFRKEVQFLSSCGFKYTFVKKNEYGVKTYKYTKTPELFRAVAMFYESQRNTKEFNKAKDMIDIDDAFLARVLKEYLNKKDVTNAN